MGVLGSDPGQRLDRGRQVNQLDQSVAHARGNRHLGRWFDHEWDARETVVRRENAIRRRAEVVRGVVGDHHAGARIGCRSSVALLRAALRGRQALVAGEPAPAAAARRRPARPPASPRALARPALLGRGATPRRRLAPASRAGAAGDGAPLAPAGLAALLVVALPAADGTAAAAAGGAGPDPPALGGEPAVGHRAHPGRAPQAGHRRQQRLHPPLPVAARAAAAEPDLGHVPAQPRARDLGRRPPDRPDPHLQDAVRALLHHPRPPGAGPRGGDGAPDRGLGVAAAHRGDGRGAASRRTSSGIATASTAATSPLAPRPWGSRRC